MAWVRMGWRERREGQREREKREKIWVLGELVEVNEKLTQAEFIRQTHTLEFNFKVVEFSSTCNNLRNVLI